MSAASFIRPQTWASRIHVLRERYEFERAAGRLWCWLGRHFVMACDFAIDRHRSTGRFAVCRSCDSKRHKKGPPR